MIRIGRVLRRPATVEVASEPVSPTGIDKRTEAIVVELGAARVVIGPGFDQPTLAAVLDVLATRGGPR